MDRCQTKQNQQKSLACRRLTRQVIRASTQSWGPHVNECAGLVSAATRANESPAFWHNECVRLLSLAHRESSAIFSLGFSFRQLCFFLLGRRVARSRRIIILALMCPRRHIPHLITFRERGNRTYWPRRWKSEGPKLMCRMRPDATQLRH